MAIIARMGSAIGTTRCSILQERPVDPECGNSKVLIDVRIGVRRRRLPLGLRRGAELRREMGSGTSIAAISWKTSRQ